MSRRDSFGWRVLRGVLHGPSNLIPEPEPAPIDWRARWEAAALEAHNQMEFEVGDVLEQIADQVPPHKLEAIGRALLGEEP